MFCGDFLTESTMGKSAIFFYVTSNSIPHGVSALFHTPVLPAGLGVCLHFLLFFLNQTKMEASPHNAIRLEATGNGRKIGLF